MTPDGTAAILSHRNQWRALTSFRAPLLFEQPVNELVFDALLLESPVLSADPRLCAMLDRQAQEMLAALPPTDALSYRVRGFLCEALGRSELSADAAARRRGGWG
jgi:hypothetical protein